MTVIEPNLLLCSEVSLNHSQIFMFKANPSKTISKTTFASCLYQESRIQYQMFKKQLVMMRVKKIATRMSELMMSLKAMLKAIRILSRLNQTKYIITTNLLSFNPWVTYDIHLTVLIFFVLFKWKNTYTMYSKMKNTKMNENHLDAWNNDRF